MKIIIPITYFLIVSSLFNLINAAERDSVLGNNYNIKAGLSVSRVYFKTSLFSTISNKEDHTESTGIGFNTSFGYRWNNWELMAGSDVLFGTLKNISFPVNGKDVTGDGYFRSFTFSPLVRYYTPYTLYNRWSFYVDAGPTWSLDAFILSNTSNGSNFSSKERITFENQGGSLNIGFEEIVPYKETHPSFFEIGYSYIKSRKIYIVDASNVTDVVTLQSDKSKDLNGHYFIFRFGITLF